MTWEEKACALQSLGSLTVRLRGPGNWYASCEGVGFGDGNGVLHTFGNGANPQEAIEAYWAQLTNFSERWKWIEVGRGASARGYRWNGFMWALVDPQVFAGLAKEG